VSKQKAKTARPRTGKRHPDLFHQRFSEQTFWPAILIVALTAASLIWNPPTLEPYRDHLSLICAVTALILIITLGLRLRAFVRCMPDGLRVQLPFYGLTIPYRDIRSTRPTELYRLFPPDRMRRPQRYFLRTLFGATVVVLDMEQLPRSQRWLRLWMAKYMICPDSVGLILAVRDWIALRSELDDFRARSKRR
jgi:hypothetical protein